MSKDGDLGLPDTLDSQVEAKSTDRPRIDTASNTAESTWIGIQTNHRRLFESGQRGWFEPLQDIQLQLGLNDFVVEESTTADDIIPVRLSFYLHQLPIPIVEQCTSPTGDEENETLDTDVVFFNAPLPLYALRSIGVSSSAQKTRLLAISRNFSNVSFPIDKIQITEFPAPQQAPLDCLKSTRQLMELPESLDAIHGAMAMSVWSVPRVQPWIDVLRLSLNNDSSGADDALRELGVSWLKLPWLAAPLNVAAQSKNEIAEHKQRTDSKKFVSKTDLLANFNPESETLEVHTDSTSINDVEHVDTSLWQAALACMPNMNTIKESPATIAQKIAESALVERDEGGIKAWFAETKRILDAEETIKCDPAQHHGAGLAIQLVLLRPEPMHFKSWSTSLRGLPPAVWWAAATLCGWQHGYRSLDKLFRGDSDLQEYTTIRALAAGSTLSEAELLPACHRSPLQQIEKEGCFTLSWCDREVIQKKWQGRAKWYTNLLTEEKAREAAQALAQQLSWPCVEKWLELPIGKIATEGSGDISIQGDSIVIENGFRNLRLSDALIPVERIDREAFRRFLVTGPGFVTDPPKSSMRREIDDVPGLVYQSNFVTSEEELHLLKLIDDEPWSNVLKRRVQHYGWRYDYKQRQIDETMRIGTLPKWAKELAQRLVSEGLMKYLADQLIVNEYVSKQGISKHRDQPSIFEDEVATLSLLETWSMVFRRSEPQLKVEVPLEARSVAVLTNDARYAWTHEIPQRLNERLPNHDGESQRVKRGRRVSLTFRKVRKSV